MNDLIARVVSKRFQRSEVRLLAVRDSSSERFEFVEAVFEVDITTITEFIGKKTAKA